MYTYPEGYTVTTLRPSNKGRNARNTSLSRPSTRRTKRAKRQNPEAMGRTPYMRTSTINPNVL